MSLKITIPFLPPSMNQIYQIVPYWSAKRIKIHLRDDVLKWKNDAKAYIQKWDESVPEGGNGSLWMSYSVYGNWLTKEGKFRKVDLPNFEKVLVDVIFEKLGLDDSILFEMRMRKKIQAESNKVEAEIGYVVKTPSPCDGHSV